MMPTRETCTAAPMIRGRWQAVCLAGLSAVCGLVLAGCGKKQPASTPPTAEQSAGEAAAVGSAPVAAQPAAPAQRIAPAPGADVPVDLDSLTQALRRFSAEKRRVPASLNEVVAAGYIKVLPPAPPGRKFAINPQRVEVILVKE